MATVTKNFKIKSGLVVEGTTGTINGEDILTKSEADIDYIIDQVGGSGVSTNTPNTLVLRDANGDFAAGTITADLTGQVSDLSNHDTDDLSEGTTNKYFTDNRVIDVLTGSTQTNISITNVGGDLHIAAENGVADSDTDDLSEGTTNKYFTDARARLAISEGTGINYDNATGVISADLGDFDTNDLAEGTSNKYFTTGRVDDHLSGGDGVSYSGGVISADVAGGLEITAGQIVVDRDTVDTWYDANGAAGDVASDLTTHETATSGIHGVTGNIVGTTDIQDLSNKTIIDTLSFSDGVTIAQEGEIAVLAVSHEFEIKANDGDLHLKTVAAGADVLITSDTGDIVLDADGTAYYGSASAENEIATHGYVDNAISGLTWKQSVNLLYDAAIPTMSGSGATQLVVDGHDALGDADSGYRLLLTGATSPGIYVYNSTGGTWTLTRSEDADVFGELIGAAVYVMEGTQYGSTSWVQGNHYLTDFTGQSWTQFSGQGSVTAGSGITVDGLEVSIDRTTVDTWYDAAGDAASAVSTHSGLTTGVHGVTGDVVGTSDSQTLTNKTIDASSNTISNIANSSLTNSGITVNGYSTDLGSSVTLDTDDVSEGTAQYFTEARARQSLSSGTAINYDNATGVISIDATQLDTDDISEGATNQYYTDARVKSVLTASTQSNISITDVGGELIITAENGVEDSTTDDLEEGANNHYFTESRAKIAAADLLVNHSTKTNITITGDETGLVISAENGVADSDTDDLTEGSTNLYFTDARAVSALEAVVPNFTAVELNSVAKQVASTLTAATAGIHIGHAFAKADYRSAEFFVKVAYGTHTEVSKVLLTLDTSDNIAITEYGIVGTNGSASTVSADISGANVRLVVTTTNNDSTVTVVGTLLV